MNPVSLPTIRAAALSAILTCLAPRSARAENAVSFKHQDYRETGGRIVVRTQGAYVEKDFGTATHLKVEGILDAITGASPNGQPAPAGSDQVPLTQLTERRKAWAASLAHQFTLSRLAVGFANSRESDYVSTGWSLNSQTDFNEKNTTLLIGVAGADDDIKVFHQTDRANKRTNDVIVGVTQLLDPQTSVTLNLTWSQQRGYLADPYKLVQKDTQIIPGVVLPLTFPENRPGERDKWMALAILNRALPRLHAAIDLSYRIYHDTYDATAHTFDASWFQRIGGSVMLRPSFRFHDQSAASFYRYRLDGTSIVPQSGPPRPQGPFYSSDYRLSELQTFTFGVKLIWSASDALKFDAAYERYEMRGTDGVTPQSAYIEADIVTLGGRFSW